MLQEAKQVAAAASTEDARLQQSGAKIKEVEKQIAEVEAEIADLKKSGAPEVWRDEVAALRREKEQLREEMLILIRRADASAVSCSLLSRAHSATAAFSVEPTSRRRKCRTRKVSKEARQTLVYIMANGEVRFGVSLQLPLVGLHGMCH